MRRVAILVGNATFGAGSGLTNLRFPIADVQGLDIILRDPEIGRYDRVVSVIDKRADEILTELNGVLDEERGASVLFYYSGHGKPSDTGKLYLAASNTTERLLPATGVSFASILEMKDSYGFGRFAAILDCCFAGLGSPDIKGAEDDRLKAFTEGRGIFFLGAANATEAAKEDINLGHGVLTAAILEGLKTGLADMDGDGRISGPDLFAWCRDFAKQHGSHKPVQVNRVADDDLVLAFSRRRLSPEDIERVQAKLLVCFANRMMGLTDLDRLRQYFLDPIFTQLPVPGSLEGDFLDYARGKLAWDEFSRRQAATTGIAVGGGAAIARSEANPSAPAFRPTFRIFMEKFKRQKKFLFCTAIYLVAMFSFMAFAMLLAQLYTTGAIRLPHTSGGSQLQSSSQPSAEDHPQSVGEASLWSHNGSLLQLVSGPQPGRQRFIFFKPRLGLANIGVTPGMVQFAGLRDGNEFRGSGYAFSRGCGALSFEMVGNAVNEQLIILRGIQPQVEAITCVKSALKIDVEWKFEKTLD
jgi:hypothetical protein